MIYFVVLLLVVLMSFGVSRQSILNPNEEPQWRLVRDVFFQPYFMLYGEVFADDIDPPCGEDPTQPPCITGQWITPIAMSMYLLIANILLINLLIAVFNNIFNETNSISHQVWMFQRFTVVMEYQQKPVLPPPLIAICHLYSLLRYCIRKSKNLKEVCDNGLKLFLEKDDLEKLYDFEEECVEGFFHEQNLILMQSTEERIRNTDERCETMATKIEDINVKENMQSLSIQNMEFRLRKMEESTEQILNHLAVIHRFMSTHISNENLQGSMVNIPITLPSAAVGPPMLDSRMRTVSENETTNMLLCPPKQKRFIRSLTEVRPDAYIFDDGAHFEPRNVMKELSTDELNELQLLQRGTTRKLSVQSEEPEYCATSPETSNLVQSESADVALERSASVCQRPPTLMTRQETKDTETSAESRDTLTPLDVVGSGGGSDEKNTIEQQPSTEENDSNYEGLRQRITAKRRHSQLGRRNSECQNVDINRSQNSLNIIPTHQITTTRRQFSLTQSEPDSEQIAAAAAMPAPKTVTKPGRHLLLQIHAEYTSITDELESMITSPTISLLDEKPKNLNELSNPEFAALIETKHLKECEDDDYEIMERLLQTRCSIDESDEAYEEPGFASDYSKNRMLRRETAIELPITPKKSLTTDETSTTCTKSPEFHVKNEKTNRNATFDNSKLSPGHSGVVSYLLNPSEADPSLKGLHKKSSESLQKNSSSETDYSALPYPYRVIKQGSNDTNSSMANDNLSITQDLSIEADTNVHAVDAVTDELGGRTFQRASTMSAAEGRPSFLRKQFSVDGGGSKQNTPEIRPHSLDTCIEFRSTVRTHESSQQHQHHPPAVPPRNMPLTSSINRQQQMNALKESTSTSTDDSSTELTRKIPSISTELVQDEIVKLSSNIKGSVDDETPSTTTSSEDKDAGNETMC